MRYIQNLHTHTTLCDGRSTPEEVVLSALSLGMNGLGFSGHSPISWSRENWAAMDVAAYRAEIGRLREKYTSRLDIFLGMELDIDSEPPTETYDYLIGSVHNVWAGGIPLSVDNTAQATEDAIREHFSGDPYAFAEAYYRRLAGMCEKMSFQIVGHFDLPTKFNEDGRFFDEDHPRYRAAALEALDALSGAGLIFEINTGAMAKGYRTAPYPAAFLLRAICRQGGRICLSSDSHRAGTLLHAFPQAAGLAKACGFRESWVLTKTGFQPQAL